MHTLYKNCYHANYKFYGKRVVQNPVNDWEISKSVNRLEPVKSDQNPLAGLPIYSLKPLTRLTAGSEYKRDTPSHAKPSFGQTVQWSPKMKPKQQLQLQQLLNFSLYRS